MVKSRRRVSVFNESVVQTEEAIIQKNNKKEIQEQ